MNHALKAKEFLKDSEYASWHDKALWYVRQKRDSATSQVQEWESLREIAKEIKKHTIEHLGYYLKEFEKNAKSNGVNVYWAKDANEHNKIVEQILKKERAKSIVKSKSMLTEECGLNSYLEDRGYEITDTDLGERIVQLRGDTPSHIVLPAIHLKKEQIGKLFEEKLNSKKGNFDPTYLTSVAREDLRKKFLNADVAITGANFAVASSGAVVVCTNEGNADLGCSLAKSHIVSMGIEKVVPSYKELGIFTRLLARSATGQAITTYTSHFLKPQNGKSMHIIIVDNRRSELIKSNQVEALNCIRCGACMNTCPVYRRSGGHSYSYIIPGPIGSILGSFREPKADGDLAYACSLCASCDNVCPVKIELHNQLYSFRKEFINSGYMPKRKRFFYNLSAKVLKDKRLFFIVTKVYKFTYPLLKRFNLWGEGREIPKPAKESFKEWYEKQR